MGSGGESDNIWKQHYYLKTLKNYTSAWKGITNHLSDTLAEKAF